MKLKINFLFIGVATISNSCGLEGHVMISYNRSAMAMCLKIRDRLKVNHFRRGF